MLGEGILKGLAETARNFAGSYVSKERLTTVQYPEERLPLPEASRNFPFLVYDGDDWETGTALRRLPDLREGMPAQVHLHREEQGQEAGLRGQAADSIPRVFDIDISVCMSCQICVEVCPFEAIKMDTRVRAARPTTASAACCCDRKQLAKSNEYYHKIHPTEAAEVDARLAAEKAKAEAKAKAAAAAKPQQPLLPATQPPHPLRRSRPPPPPKPPRIERK